MASIATTVHFGIRNLTFSYARTTHGSAFNMPLSVKSKSLRLSSSHRVSASSSFVLHKFWQGFPRFHQISSTIVAAKGYKMKTRKASAKRFRVTGSGKIMRRRAGKQHLLSKKSTKRKLRLSKMHPVSRSDYGNVTGALPYLKVNRKAT